jgi:ABC exporter DevB family membrane fusion protein
MKLKLTGLTTKITLIITTLIAGAIAFYGVWRYHSSGQPFTLSETVSEEKITSVAAIGYIEPQGEVIKLSAPAFQEGSRVEQLLVKEGDTVNKGDVIAILDNHERLLATLKQAEAKIQLAKSNLSKVRQGAKQGDIQAQLSRFQGLKAELEGQIMSQKAAIASLEAQLQGQALAQQATIERIEAELKNAIADCQRYQSLYIDGAVSEELRDNFCLIKTTKEKNLAEAQANLTRIKQTLTQQIIEAEANLQRTITTLNQQITENQAQLDSVTEIRPIDIQIAEDELNLAQTEWQRSQADFNLSYVRSPQNGQILKINTFPGELVTEKGIVEVGFTEQMYVNAEIYETDINKIKKGNKAIIKTDNLIGELTGEVEQIGLSIARKNILSTDPVADTDARVVEIKIRLNPLDSLKVAQFTDLKVNVIIQTKP